MGTDPRISITDTVERRILDLGVREGLSLYSKASASGTLLNVAEGDNLAQRKKIDSGKKGKGDFVHRWEDHTGVYLIPS
jgi:E3 ubiquitin-protein ligase SHPRH